MTTCVVEEGRPRPHLSLKYVSGKDVEGTEQPHVGCRRSHHLRKRPLLGSINRRNGSTNIGAGRERLCRVWLVPLIVGVLKMRQSECLATNAGRTTRKASC